MPAVVLRYAVENTREDSVTVDGLAVLGPKEVKELSDQEVASFETIRGLKPNQVHFPEGIEVFIVVEATEGK